MRLEEQGAGRLPRRPLHTFGWLDAAEAIGVSRCRGNWTGGWAQLGRTREMHYMDPSILPMDAA